MSIRGKSVKGSLVLTLGEGVGYGASFVRNMILARMLTKADFGITATLSMIITLLEFSGKLGIARFVVRDKEGDEPGFIAAAHLVQGLTAVFSAMLMLAFARPLSVLFGIAEHVGGIYLLALVPLLQGISHLDIRRYERELRFGPSTLAELIPQVIITVAAFPVAKWLGDYRAVLVLLLGKALINCLISHLLAEQSYRWELHREYVSRMLRFGWPLLLTGFVQFGVMQGDQFLVATFYTMADLGPYAAAAGLTLAPSFLFARIFNSIALPVMAKAQDEPLVFERRYRTIMGVMCAFSAAYSVGMILGAETLMILVFGAKYAGSGIILAWLAASNSFRNIRIAPAIAAMARGDSHNHLLSNLARVVALAPAAVVAVAGYPVWCIACCGLIGEALACYASFSRLKRVDRVPLSASFYPTAWITLSVAISGILSYLWLHSLSPVLNLTVALLGSSAAVCFMTITLPELRSEASKAYAHWQQTGLKGCIACFRAPKPPAPVSTT